MKVRSATTAMLALASLALGPPAAAHAAAGAPAQQPRVTIALLPHGTELDALADAVPGISPGLLSGGLGAVSAGQTYLDVGQGARLSQSLYPKALPPVYVTGDRVPERIWRRVRGRAGNAPAEIVPGLLASTLEQAGVPVAARPLSGSAAIIAADRSGRIERADGCLPPRCPGVTVAAASLGGVASIASRIDPGRGDLLIAIERPPTERELLSIGILGAGFGDGDLTSATTRMDGYVLATDLLPTILARYETEVPATVSGRAIETGGDAADAAAVGEREERLGEVRARRWPVLGVNLLIWLGLVGAATALAGRRGAALGIETLAVALALVPAFGLAGAALEPSELIERIIVGAGAPLLAALTLAALRPLGDRAPYAAFALAAAVSVCATALDMVAGSPLTALSLLGPNPALGVRFFGIGNELEATIGALLPLGAGAAVTAMRPAATGRAMAIAIAIATLVAVGVFAPGRLGADVGAAITFPAGAAVAVIVALGLSRRWALVVLAAPLVALAALVLIDLLSGGDAHLSRSVLGADDSAALGDVFERRVLQAARTFPRYVGSPFFIATAIGIVAAVHHRRRIGCWVEGRPAALAGLAGAVAATVVGTLANDSAVLLLMIGTGLIAAFCGLAWAASGTPADRPGR